MHTVRSTAPSRDELEPLAEEVRVALHQVLAAAGEEDWTAASRRVLELVHAARRLETEVDFQYMSEWLSKAQRAGATDAG